MRVGNQRQDFIELHQLGNRKLPKLKRGERRPAIFAGSDPAHDGRQGGATASKHKTCHVTAIPGRLRNRIGLGGLKLDVVLTLCLGYPRLPTAVRILDKKCESATHSVLVHSSGRTPTVELGYSKILYRFIYS